MIDRATDREYLEYQYGDSEKLRIRIEAHERYSENGDDFIEWSHVPLDPRPGMLVLDVGCGFGGHHPRFAGRGARVVGVDQSAGLVREARRRAIAQGLPVVVARADARALPLADATCDRVAAFHMLFHLPEPLLSLQEMRRVLKPTGRVVMSTNAADHTTRLWDLHCQAARERGYTPTAKPGSRFTLDDLPLVRSVFPNVQRRVFTNAFVFPTAEAALRFYATGRVDAIQERRSDGGHRPKLLAAVGARIEAIIAREGVFRDPKDAGYFVASV